MREFIVMSVFNPDLFYDVRLIAFLLEESDFGLDFWFFLCHMEIYLFLGLDF
jgi:hypothetical protein